MLLRTTYLGEVRENEISAKSDFERHGGSSSDSFFESLGVDESAKIISVKVEIFANGLDYNQAPLVIRERDDRLGQTVVSVEHALRPWLNQLIQGGPRHESVQPLKSTRHIARKGNVSKVFVVI